VLVYYVASAVGRVFASSVRGVAWAWAPSALLQQAVAGRLLSKALSSSRSSRRSGEEPHIPSPPPPQVPPGEAEGFVETWRDVAEKTIKEKGNRIYRWGGGREEWLLVRLVKCAVKRAGFDLTS